MSQRLKSGMQHVVTQRTSNPDAPFGYDERDQPIGVPAGPQYIPVQQTGTVEPRPEVCDCDHPWCRHCHPKNNIQTKLLSNTETPVTDAFKYNREPESYEPFKFLSEVLGITPRTLLKLFDVVVGTEVVVTGKLETRLKDTSEVQRQIATLTERIEHANRNLVWIPQLTKRSERLILSWSAQVMKHGTSTIPPRAKDDVLDERTREKFKYYEKKKLAQYKRWTNELRTIVRGAQERIDKLQQRLDNWGSSPEDLETVTVTEEIPITFRQRFREPRKPVNDPSESYRRLRKLGNSNADIYVSLMTTEYQGLLDIVRRGESLQPWGGFETEIILLAVGYELIWPSKKAFEKYPSLEKYLDQDTELARTLNEVIHTDSTEQEGRLILKTGGAQINATIRNFGFDRKGRPRQSGSFDNAVKFGKNRVNAFGDEGPSSFLSGLDSGDLSERGGDE